MATRSSSYIYTHAPCMASMKLDEGAWTDNDDYKLGGYFANPLTKGQWVALSGDWTVNRMTASNSLAVGYLASEPISGAHTSGGRYGNIMLLGDFVKEVEILSGSGNISLGGSIKPADGTGSLNEGVWTVDTVSNGTFALASYSSGSTQGTTIPVLFGYTTF